MTITSSFQPPGWLKNPHGQTLWASLIKRCPAPLLQWHRLELSDGDFVDLCSTPQADGPVTLILHGLEGSIHSPYARSILYTLQQRRFNGVLYHFRGCSGEPNRLPRRYHFGDTGDLPEVIEFIKTRYPNKKIFVVGYSLGGNVALKWLGEQKDKATFDAGVAISVPFSLHDAAERLNTSFSKFYQWHLLNKLKNNLSIKSKILKDMVDVRAGLAARTFRQYDDLITAPLHGFKGVDDYYTRSSCMPFLKKVQTPALIIHAKDDPFMWPTTLPRDAELAPMINVQVESHGGHVGFISSRHSLIHNEWLENRIVSFLEHYI